MSATPRHRHRRSVCNRPSAVPKIVGADVCAIRTGPIARRPISRHHDQDSGSDVVASEAAARCGVILTSQSADASKAFCIQNCNGCDCSTSRLRALIALALSGMEC